MRSVALCTWVAAFAHVLVLVQGVESWTVGSVVQVAHAVYERREALRRGVAGGGFGFMLVDVCGCC